jgi:hypothetical protein
MVLSDTLLVSVAKAVCYFLVVSIKFSAETYITRYKSRGLSAFAVKLSLETLPLSIIVVALTFKKEK